MGADQFTNRKFTSKPIAEAFITTNRGQRGQWSLMISSPDNLQAKKSE